MKIKGLKQLSQTLEKAGQSGFRNEAAKWLEQAGTDFWTWSVTKSCAPDRLIPAAFCALSSGEPKGTGGKSKRRTHA